LTRVPDSASSASAARSSRSRGLLACTVAARITREAAGAVGTRSGWPLCVDHDDAEWRVVAVVEIGLGAAVCETVAITQTMRYDVVMSSEERAVRDLVELRLAARSMRRGSKPYRHVWAVSERLEDDIGPGVHKRPAARILGITVPALDRWIRTGRIATVPAGTGSRRLVARDDLIALATEVNALREHGHQRGLLSAAISNLERSDPTFQNRLMEAIEPGVRALREGDLVAATIPENFGPED
jgi:hypothetical protein